MHELNPIGVGIMGFADTLIMLGINYDSKAATDFISHIGGTYVDVTNATAPDSFYRRSIAPTGTLSILGSCSSGIEPVFATEFERHLTIGVIKESNPLYSSGYCRTAHSIDPIWHLRIQAAWQELVDAGVSKSINCHANTTVEDISRIYLQAWKLGVKGVTVFRDRSVEGVLKAVPQVRQKCEGEACAL
jgi:ribonucleoside-diphosphate reductase alpha chain